MAVSVASTMSLAGFAGADSGAERAKFESNGPFGETITRGAMTGSPSLVDASAARDAVATAAKAAVAAEPEKGLQTKEIPAPPERRPWTRARGDSGKILPRWVLPWRETGPEDKAETFAATVSALTAGAAGLGAVGVYVLDPRLLALLAGAGLAAGLGVALVTLLRRALKDDVPEEPLTGLLIAGLTGTTVGLASPLAAGAWVGVHGGYWTVRAVQALLGAAAAGIKGGWNAGNRALSWVLDKVGGR